MGRSNQFIGLNQTADDLMAKYKGYLAGIEKIGEGYYEKPFFGKVWYIPRDTFEGLKSPVLVRERIQEVCFSSGPMFFTHLVLDFCDDKELENDDRLRHELPDGRKVIVKSSELTEDGQGLCSWVVHPLARANEFDYSLGIYWV